MSASRPENTGPPELFYNAEEAHKYHNNSRIITIQRRMTERAIQLLDLPEGTPAIILDIGCGSGISCHILEEQGHTAVGLDISRDMLSLNTCDNIIEHDVGQGLPLAPGFFDGCISISALQWLCYSNSNAEQPYKRLLTFFQSLYSSLRPQARAVFQFYPENEHQLHIIEQTAIKAGFGGGTVIDFPNSTKAKKFYLTLHCGSSFVPLPKGLTEEHLADEDEEATYFKARTLEQKRSHRRTVKTLRPVRGSREYILQKKIRDRLKGKDIKPLTKYSGRRRKNAGW